MPLLAASRLLSSAVRTRVVPALNLSTRPARDPLSLAEQAIGLTVFFTAFLGPSCWVLANLENYKKKE